MEIKRHHRMVTTSKTFAPGRGVVNRFCMKDVYGVKGVEVVYDSFRQVSKASNPHRAWTGRGQSPDASQGPREYVAYFYNRYYQYLYVNLRHIFRFRVLRTMGRQLDLAELIKSYRLGAWYTMRKVLRTSGGGCCELNPIQPDGGPYMLPVMVKLRELSVA
jgi:hypothetical protein